MKTLYDIEVNKDLLWDQSFTPDDFKKETFFIWYLGRLLERGTAEEIKRLPTRVVARYLDRLAISNRVRHFWHWYLTNA